MVTDRDQTPRQTAKIAPWGGHFYTGNKGLGDELIPPLTSLKISYCTTHVDPHRYQKILQKILTHCFLPMLHSRREDLMTSPQLLLCYDEALFP